MLGNVPRVTSEVSDCEHENNVDADIELGSSSMAYKISPSDEKEPSLTLQKPSTWLSFNNKEHYILFRSFLQTQSSLTTIFVVIFALTLTFGIYMIRLLTSESVSSVGPFIFIGRGLRFLSCAFGWVHIYFLKYNTFDKNTTQKIVIFTADQFILWSSMVGTFLLLVRCVSGACDEDQNEDTCNPRHDDKGLPTDTLVANLFMIALLPVIFKAHGTINMFVSYCVTFIGLIVAAVITKATADVLLIFACIFAFGMMIYDHERNMMSQFLAILGQQAYYDRLLAVERLKASAEVESAQLRSLIGSIAHDLKTPLQAIMVELDGLQLEVEAIKQHIHHLTHPKSTEDTFCQGDVTERTDEAQKYIDSLRDIYQFMMMALNRAIEFRKTSAGLALLPSHETFHLPKAIEWSVARFANNPSGVPIRVQNFFKDTECCPFLISDKHWVTESILTLLSNACKFTTQGEITLRCSLVRELSHNHHEEDISISKSSSQANPDSDVAIRSVRDVVSFETGEALFERITPSQLNRKPNDMYFVRIEVEDTGCGVGPDKIPSIFDPFGHGLRQSGGTGLGLFSLSKRIEVLRGKCGLSPPSSGVAGSCFWFTFPYNPDSKVWHVCGKSTEPNMSLHSFRHDSHRSSSEKMLCHLDEELSHKSKTSGEIELGFKENAVVPCDFISKKDGKNLVLLVDDSTLVLKTTSRMLSKVGFDVQTAQNGKDALHMMQSRRYYFVLSDIQMPVMDGLEMTLQIRQIEQSLPDDGVRHHIIGMSANSDAETRDDSFSCGMNAFIPKPVRMHELLKHVPEVQSET